MNLEQIDTSTTAGKAEVMRLAAEGRRVASHLRAMGHSFEEDSRPEWSWAVMVYAIIAEPVLDRPARVGGRDFPAGALIQQVIGRAHAEFDRHHHARDPRDVASDPEGFLVYANGEPMKAAKRREPVGPEEKWCVIGADGRTMVTGDTRSGVENYARREGMSIVRYIRSDIAELPWEKC